MTKHQKLSLLFAAIGLLCLTFAFGILLSANAYHLLRSGKYEQSLKNARQALPIARLVNKTWVSGLKTIVAANTTLLSLQKIQENVDNGETPNITEFAGNLKELEVSAQAVSVNIENSKFLTRLLGSKLGKLDTAIETLTHVVPLAQYFTEGEKTLLVLLQNSDELRATGGFMGSYALLHFNSGSLSEILVEDIYDADGQVQEYFEPPKGVAEFLSGGKGWRLPDANWNPDFALSSQDTLRFFALASRNHIDGVVAINLPVVQSLLAITGPITLSDQDIVLSETNVDQVLRADRDAFFAGSTAKKDIIALATTQLKLAVAKLNTEEKKQIIEQFRQQILRGNVLVYFPNQELEKQAQALGLSGSLGPQTLQSNTLFYYPLESNVGINKVNAAVTREFVMTTSDTLTELGISLHNNSTQDGYVNYQRLLFSPGQDIEQIVVNGEQVSEFDRETVTSSTGQQYDQIGFLVTTLPNNITRIALTLTHSADFLNILLQKQPGTADTTLTSITQNGAKTHQLDQSFLEYMIE
ncbi:MAG: DUF4012 domain-containing protein [Candidatus Pacebacteria bacterium]|nr:DUF4012 domain-containing protein [Candidatus Paceibacterota bacterium]